MLSGRMAIRKRPSAACLTRVAATLFVLFAGACAEPAPGPESAPLRLFSSNGVRAAIEAIQPEIENAAGVRLAPTFSTAAALKRQIDAGEAFDVAILTPVLIDDLVMKGTVAADSRADLARVGVGVGAREGAPRSDVSTPDGLRQTLMNAKVVAYTAEGQSRATVDKALAQLGLTDAVAAKAMITGPGEGPGAVAAGKADLVMTLISEIVVPGVQLLGPFPAEMQNYVVFTAARGINARNVEAANAFIDFLTGPQGAAAMKAHALEPIAE